MTRNIKIYYNNNLNDKEPLISQENFDEILNILITNSFTGDLEGLIDMYLDLYSKKAKTYQEEYVDSWTEEVLKSGLVFLMKIGKYERAIKLYKKLKITNIKSSSVIEICKIFFEQKKINELKTFLNIIEEESEQIEGLLKICSLLVNNKSESEAIEIILAKKNKYRVALGLGESLYEFLLKLKESKSIQERFNCRNLYFKTFLILNSTVIDKKHDNINKYFLLSEVIYLTSCMKNKLQMVREFNDLFSKIMSIKQNKEIDDAIKKIIDIVESQIIKIEHPIPKRTTYLDFLFNLFKYNLNFSKKHLNKIVESHRVYCQSKNFPSIISHNQIWDGFLSRYEELCKSNTNEAIKIIEFKIYPMVNWLPGKNLEYPLHKRIILGLIDQKKEKEALEYYNRHKNLTHHEEFYLKKITEESTTIFLYKNFKTKEILKSNIKLFDQIFSIEDLESILLKFKNYGFYNAAKVILEDIKIIYSLNENNLYSNIIFNGLYEIEGDIEHAYIYLKTFHENNQYLYMNFNLFRKESKKESRYLKRKKMSLLDPSVLKKISYNFLSSYFKNGNAQKIFLTENIQAPPYNYYSQLYIALHKYNKLHLVLKDILNSNIKSPYFDSSEIITNGEYMYEHDLDVYNVFINSGKGDVTNPIRCRINELQQIKKVNYYNKVPFNGIAYEIYSNYSIKRETHYKNGLKNGIHKNYNRDGGFDSFIIFKDDEVDLNCFSKTRALSEFERKLNSIKNIKNKNNLLEIIKSEVGTNNLFLDLKKTLEDNDLKYNKKKLSKEILSKLNLVDGYWKDFEDWDRLVSELSRISKSELNKIKREINFDELIHTFSIKYKLKKAFEINNKNHIISDINLERVKYITDNIRSLVWISELFKVAGKEKEAINALIIAKDNHELYYNEDLISLIETAHLDSTFRSLKILLKELLKFSKDYIALDILKKITKEFSVVIEGGKTKWENWNKRIPIYGDPQYELYVCYLELCEVLWFNKKNNILNDFFAMLKNKYWLYGIKKELLLSWNIEVDKNEKKLLADLLTLNSEIEKENSIQSYAVISNFNLFVKYAGNLISKNQKDHGVLFLNKAKEIKEKYDDSFQLSIHLYNKISDVDDFWYEKEKTIIPDLEKFYLNISKVESTTNVATKIISEERKEYIDDINGKLIKREWKNKRWRVNNCFDLISKIYFENNELDKSFTHSLKIVDDKNRTDQFKLIFNNLEIEDCIRFINSNEIDKDASFFSNYLSTRIRGEFTNDGLEYSYLAKFNNHIDDFVNVFEYKVFNYYLSSENLDYKKTELLNEVLDFNELEKIKSNVVNMNN